MMKDLTIGQYFPGDSVIHRLDPRTKITLSFMYIMVLFFVKTFSAYAMALIYLYTVMKIADIPFSMLFKGIKSLIFIIVLTLALNIFMIEGETLFTIFGLTASKEGLRYAIFMALRLILMVMGSAVMTLTTSPIRLTDGLEKIMKPLEVIKVPAHEISMMMTIALRFIPTLMEETQKIIKAQKARGANFEEGSIVKRAKALVPILIPLFISSFRRADELANAMEARLYRGGNDRTKLNPLKYQKRDYLAYTIVILYFAGMIALNYTGLY
ncbi:energy-coupling factor transporter transmembrane protein EcfT [uncultured Ezakiella sp.]|uniref:energy-coupling factor transporter transmembrane component T family protein n=1 Tax=uncultured Ezakiella sp. TaxID=1637529 RepID=UPI0025FA45A3|nr:energy-coupling factor transporter transmembrane component T [uncultured Ezakiella sp.]